MERKTITRHRFEVPKSDPSSKPPFERLSEAWWASRKPEVRARRCTARRSDGTNVRCKNVALRMQTVCRYHGGAGKNAQAAARRRLAEAQDYLARLLLGLAESSESEAVKLAAIKHALTLGGTTEKVEVEVEMSPWQGIVTGINFGESRAQARARRGDAPIEADDDDFLDVEVIDDEGDDPETGAVRHARGRKDTDPHTEVAETATEPYTAGEPLLGLAAIEAAAAANRAAGVWSKKRRR